MVEGTNELEGYPLIKK